MQSIRDWYLLSRSGSRGEFFDQIGDLSPREFANLMRRELEHPPAQSLRSMDDIRKYKRVDLPPLVELKQKSPEEQILQYFFIHRGYFRFPFEIVLCREYPSSDRHVRRRAVIDLLAFDQENKRPILVELKRAKSTDPLFGAVLEALDHWIFFTRNRKLLSETLTLEGYRWGDGSPIPLAIAAPNDFFVQTKRRSDHDPTRNREYSRAIEAMTYLAEQVNLPVSLVSVEDGWQETEGNFSTNIWWQPPSN
jgi:hypothetical protein